MHGGHDADTCKSRQIADEDIPGLLPYNENFHPEEIEKLLSIMRFKFQQSINCCQTTALAYGFNVLGFRVSPDDIFSTLELDIDTVIRQGLSLAETHEMALRFIAKSRLPVFVEAYHFDEHLAIDDDKLWDICSNDFAANDVLILNFHSGIAHGRSDGGGHFALLAGCIPDTRELVISDVHPLKYGAHWAAPVGLMRSAMAGIESSGRARGILRLGRMDERTERPLKGLEKADTLLDWISPPRPYVGSHFQRYIPTVWKSHLGTMNMEGISGIALACRVLGEAASQASGVDEIMRALGASYTEELNHFAGSVHVLQLLQRLNNSGYLRSKAYAIEIPKPLTAELLRTLLKEANCGSGRHAVLAPFDLGVAFNSDFRSQSSSEANVLSHGTFSWGVIADFNLDATADDHNGLVIASAHHIDAVGRLWKCSLDNFAKAIVAAKGADSLIVLSAMSLDDQRTKLEKILSILDQNEDGALTAEDLVESLTQHGFRITAEEARAIIDETAFGRGESLDHTAAIEMLVHALSMRPEHSRPDHPRHEVLKQFLEENGCIDNNLGFATTHLALLTSDIRRCVQFYNGVIGWPLYKTVDRAHAGAKSDHLGSSWASFGAFASFTVFHLWKVPPGREGHGPWASDNDTPAALRETAFGERSLSFRDIPFPFLGVILSRRFYDLQMERIRSKGPEVVWAKIDDASSVFGEGEVESGIVFRDPDGYPLVFFVSALSDEAYRKKYPVAPFIFGTEIRAASPDPEEQQKKVHGDLAHIATCPVIASYRKDPARLPLVERWLKTHAYGKDSLAQHQHYYESILGCKVVSTAFDPKTKASQTVYAWDAHYLVTRTRTDYFGAMAGGDEGHHNMGGNKGEVLVPHFGLNMAYETFADLRRLVQRVMKRHGVPQDLCESFSKMGHAPARNLLDSFHFLFADDPDTCLSMFVCDPSGNMNEIKWYLDFGEMFKEQGTLGMSGIEIDNSMVTEHFPPDVLKMMERRGLRGDQEGLEILRAEQGRPMSSRELVVPSLPQRRQGPGFSVRIGLYLQTTLQTVALSLIWPVLVWVFATAAGSAALLAVFASDVFGSLSPDIGRDIELLRPHSPLIAAATAVGALCISMWGVKDYLIGGRNYIVKTLKRRLPSPGVRSAYSARALRGLHNRLRWSGACAFLLQIALQCLAFGAMSWGLATAFPGLHLFVTSSQATLWNSALFWVDDVVTVEGHNLIGHALSPLAPVASVPVSGALIVFKLLIVGLIAQLVWTTLSLRPLDLSRDGTKTLDDAE